MINDLEFIQLYAAKISHDLAGTLGAIGSAIEFVSSEDAEVRRQALELMEISSNSATDKLKFYRYAYGISKYSGDADLSTLRELCLSLGKEKIEVEFLAPGSISNEKSINVDTGKLILCLASLATTALIHGGVLKVSWENDTRSPIIISATGKEIKHQTDANNIINGSSEVAITAQNIHAYYIKRLIDTKNIKVNIKTEANMVNYIIDPKTA